jgi:hypothetical protein
MKLSSALRIIRTYKWVLVPAPAEHIRLGGQLPAYELVSTDTLEVADDHGWVPVQIVHSAKPDHPHDNMRMMRQNIEIPVILKVKPFNPKEAAANKISSIPPVVLKAVNQLLAEKYNQHGVTLKQADVIKRILELDIEGKLDGTCMELSAAILFDKGWFDFEDLYEKQGWKVTYDKPGYNESYDANWSFEKK